MLWIGPTEPAMLDAFGAYPLEESTAALERSGTHRSGGTDGVAGGGAAAATAAAQSGAGDGGGDNGVYGGCGGGAVEGGGACAGAGKGACDAYRRDEEAHLPGGKVSQVSVEIAAPEEPSTTIDIDTSGTSKCLP
uniref:Uncharacterized protein n=2 Tax=Chrysotila carterae TaxID=13221 RepID=A0A7S4BIV2_CHRCT